MRNKILFLIVTKQKKMSIKALFSNCDETRENEKYNIVFNCDETKENKL